jgi:hypothetical protein
MSPLTRLCAARKLRSFGGEFRALERAPRLETDEKDPLPVPGHTLCALMIFQ